MYEYKAHVVRVIDGDTFDAKVDVGFSITIKHRFRLADVDTPETWRPRNDAERRHGEQATLRVRALIEGQEVTLRTGRLGIYGRYQTSVRGAFGDLAELLRAEGLVKLASYES